MNRMKVARVVAGVVCVALLATACSKNAEADKTTLVVATDSDIHSPDVTRYQNLTDIFATTNMFDSLTWRGMDGSTEPMIATKWDVSGDGLQWTVDIRTDVVFHNGEPLTADDVAYSILRMAAEEYAEPINQYWSMVEDAEVVDDDTVVFRLSEPNGLFMQQAVRGYIVPKDYIERVGDEAFSAAPVASGPYKFVEWIPGQRLALEANGDYWQGAPAIKNLIIRPIVEEASRTAALRSGEVDVVHPLGLDQLQLVEDDPELDVRSTDSIERVRLIFDTTKPPFNDVRVRKAVNHAINKQQLVEELLEGHADVTAGVAVPLEEGYNPDLQPYSYDPQRARQLLAEAGHGGGLTVDFAVRTGYPKAEEITQAIAGYLAEVGIQTKMRLYDAAGYADASRDKTLPPLSFSGWGGGGQFHATNVLNVVLRCEGHSVVFGGYYCNPEMDRHLDEALRLWGGDEQAARQHLAEAQRIVHEDAGNGFLYLNTRVYGVKAGLKWEPRPDGMLWMVDASWT